MGGKTPMVLELGDPLQMRPVRTVSLFDTKDMLMQRAERGDPVSIEAQWGIKAFNTFDYAFELTQTKRFLPGDPNAPFFCKACATPMRAQGRWSTLAYGTCFSADVSRRRSLERF